MMVPLALPAHKDRKAFRVLQETMVPLVLQALKVIQVQMEI